MSRNSLGKYPLWMRKEFNNMISRGEARERLNALKQVFDLHRKDPVMYTLYMILEEIYFLDVHLNKIKISVEELQNKVREMEKENSKEVEDE